VGNGAEPAVAAFLIFVNNWLKNNCDTRYSGAPKTEVAMNDAPAAPTAKPRDYKAEWAKRKKREAERKNLSLRVKPKKSRAKPRSELRHPNKAWTPEHRRKFIATRKRLRQEMERPSRAKDPSTMKYPGLAWSPERRAKFIKTMKARIKAGTWGRGNGTGKRIGRPPKNAKPPDVWGMRPDGQEGWLTPILQQRWVYVPKPG